MAPGSANCSTNDYALRVAHEDTQGSNFTKRFVLGIERIQTCVN